MTSLFSNCEKLAKEFRPFYDEGDFRIKIKQRLAGINFGPYRVLLKSNFNTACWVPPVGSQELHSFYYGDLMLSATVEFFCKHNSIAWPLTHGGVRNSLISKGEKFSRSIGMLYQKLSNSQKAELEELALNAVYKYARHERAHAQFTSKNLAQTTNDLKKLKVPFSIFNLFEDARIESRDRRQAEEPYNWLSIEKPGSLTSPTSLFFRCIQLDGAEDAEALSSSEVIGSYPVSDMAKRVQIYYARACACQTDKDLYPVLEDFVKEFAEFIYQQDTAGSGLGDGDLSYAVLAAEEGESFFESFDADAQDTADIPADDTEGSSNQREERSLKAFESSNTNPSESDFLAKTPTTLSDKSKNRVEALTQSLMSMFKSHTLNTTSEHSGNRISGRHLARGELRFVHKKVFGGRKERKYVAVVDCSGSMKDGLIMENCMIFLLALNNLAKRGYVKGYLVLSGYSNKGPIWLRYAFPVDDSIILRIKPKLRGEGLQPCLHDNLAIAKESDEVFIYTDANIGDAPMNNAFFARNGVIPVGLYCGSEFMLTEAKSDMERHFPQNILKNTIEEIAEVLVIRNKRVVG